MKYEIPRDNKVLITFDDEKTDAERIMKSLTRGGADVKGNPEYVR